MKKIVMMLMVSMFWVGTASATLINPIGTSGEVKLAKIYDDLYGTSYVVNTDPAFLALQNDLAMTGGVFSQAGIGAVPWIARYAGDASLLYTYTPGNAASTNLMTFSATPSGNFTDTTGLYVAGIPAGTPTIFGFSLRDTTTGEQWYTQRWLNDGNNLGGDTNKYHFLILNAPSDHPNTLLVGVEDRSSGDWDYNDFVFEFKNIKVENPVPEPATVSLLGMGLLGLLGFRRKTEV